MRRLLAAALVLAALASPAWAQTKTPAAINGCQVLTSVPVLSNFASFIFNCDTSGNLNVNVQKFSGTISATTAATAQSSLPSLSPGTNAIYENLSGALFEQPTFGGVLVSPSNGLPVNVVGGSISANSTLNATSTLPTLSSGIQTPQGSLAGAAYMQPVFGSGSGGGTQVDSGHGLPVAIVGTPAVTVTSGNITTTPSGTQTVTITGALPAGTNVLGTVTTTPSGTQTVSGTVTANQGTSPWVVSGNITTTPSGSQAVTVTSGNITSTDSGTKITSASMPSGGVGLTGWMSAVYYQLTQTLTATLTGALPAGTNVLGTVTSTQGTSPWAITDSGVKITSASMPSGGTNLTGWLSAIYYQLTLALPAGTNVIGTVTSTQGTNPWLVGLSPQTSGGLSVTSSIIAANVAGYNVKASAGQVFHIDAFSNTTTVMYLKIYNTSTQPNCGTGTPVMRLLIPANSSGAGFVNEITQGIAFSVGIGYCVTGGIADTDKTAPAANDYVVDFEYE